MLIALIASAMLNAVLLALLVLQRVKAMMTAQAIEDLLGRVAKLEEIAKRPPDKITIVQQNDKERYEQGTT